MPVKIVDNPDLDVSSAISKYYVENFIAPDLVMNVLAQAGIRFMLVGLHGVLPWLGRAPRATQDVDVLVGPKHQKKAVRVLLQHFANLVAEDHEVVTRLVDKQSGLVLIDVMKTNQPLYHEAFQYAQAIETGKQTYLAPSLELALAMKFAPMISLVRADDKKHMDAADFIRMVRNNSDINLERLHQLGELVYHGGGDELVEKVRQVRAGEQLEL